MKKLLLLLLLLATPCWAIPPSPPSSGGATASDVAYDATTWNDNTDAATKNAIRDKVETLATKGSDAVVDRVELKDYSVTCVAMGSDTTPDYDLSAGNCYTDTVDTGATTATFSNPPASGKMGNLTLILTNGGSQTYNWPASIDWSGGAAPPLTTSGVDVIDCITVDAGTIWYCFISGLDMK